MPPLAIVLLLTSALMHALWNLILKQSDIKYVAMNWQVLLSGAAALAPSDVARRALQGATASTVAKTERLDNEEQLVVAQRGARFFVYIEDSPNVQ